MTELSRPVVKMSVNLIHMRLLTQNMHFQMLSFGEMLEKLMPLYRAQ